MSAPRPVPTPIRDTAGQDRAVGRPRLPWSRRIVIVVAVTSLVAGAVLVGRRWLASEASVDADRLRVAEVTRGTLVRDAAVTGRVVAAVSPTLYAPVAGTVTVTIRAGDAVHKGDVLATIASPELENELARARSTLAELEAQLGSARIGADRQRLQADREADEAAIALTAAGRELEGAQTAWQAGALSDVEYQRAKDALDSARIRDRNARAHARLAGRSAGFDVATVLQQHERQRLAIADLERRVAELTVRAPVDGVIGTLAVAERAVVAANAPLMTVVDLGQLEVELEVPETYADDLGLGMGVELQLAAGPAPGTLSALSPEVVGGRVLARVRFTGAQPAGLRQSQRVSARILIEERPGVVLMPRGPFLEAHGGRHAYVIDGDLAVRRPIRVGASSIAAVEILEGLTPGQQVVIAGSERFGDAGSVRINR